MSGTRTVQIKNLISFQFHASSVGDGLIASENWWALTMSCDLRRLKMAPAVRIDATTTGQCWKLHHMTRSQVNICNSLAGSRMKLRAGISSAVDILLCLCIRQTILSHQALTSDRVHGQGHDREPQDTRQYQPAAGGQAAKKHRLKAQAKSQDPAKMTKSWALTERVESILYLEFDSRDLARNTML